MWREARGGLLGREPGSTHLDAGSKGWNNALWQELPSHSLALHDEVPQRVQAQLLRAGDKSTGLAGLTSHQASDGRRKMACPCPRSSRERGDDGCVPWYLPAQAGPRGIYKL